MRGDLSGGTGGGASAVVTVSGILYAISGLQPSDKITVSVTDGRLNVSWKKLFPQRESLLRSKMFGK